MTCLSLLCFCLFMAAVRGAVSGGPAICRVTPSGSDDAGAIIEAFDRCGRDGRIEFAAGTFRVGRVMNTTGLRNCLVDMRQATLQFSADTDYWLANSLDVEFQDQSTAWLLGGRNVTLLGGELDGNGQVWYDENRNRSNQPGRPIGLTIFQSDGVLVDGLTFTQPQFWASFISRSSNVTMRNIIVTAQSNSEWNIVNTDGTNTWNSRSVLLENWQVTNGDDCIAAKGNTTDLVVRNVTCHGGNGMTIGSVGQYPLTPDYVEDVLFEDVRVVGSFNAAFIKTWQGAPVDNSTNGDAGGGGSGFVRNITFRNFAVDRVALPIQITQCIYSEAQGVDCESSKMHVSDITWRNIVGTTTFNIAASLHCASRQPCAGIRFDGVDLQSLNSTLGLPNYGVDGQEEVLQCANLVDAVGIACNKEAPANFGQIVTGNIPCVSAPTAGVVTCCANMVPPWLQDRLDRCPAAVPGRLTGVPPSHHNRTTVKQPDCCYVEMPLHPCRHGKQTDSRLCWDQRLACLTIMKCHSFSTDRSVLHELTRRFPHP